jgi:hypothetical protein
MEFVQMLQRVSKAVKKLKETFLDDGYLQKIGGEIYVQTIDKDRNQLVITEDYKKGWDDL